MSELFGEFFAWLKIAALAMARPAALFTIVPILSRDLVGGLARKAVVFAFTLPVLPLVRAELEGVHVGGFTFAGFLVKEGVVGVLMGFGIGLTFWVAAGVGSAIDTQRGTSIGEIFNPLLGTSSSPLGGLLQQYLVTLFILSGGFALMLKVLYDSYTVLPVGKFMLRPQPELLQFASAYGGSLIYNVTVLVSPIILGMFLVQFGLALVNRFAQQLNVFSLSLPLMSVVAFVLLCFYLLSLTELLKAGFSGMELWPSKIFEMLNP